MAGEAGRGEREDGDRTPATSPEQSASTSVSGPPVNRIRPGAEHPDRLVVTALPPRSHVAFPLTHRYFETVYAPSLGASAIQFGRHAAFLLAEGDGRFDIRAMELAADLGFVSRAHRATVDCARLRNAITRLVRAGVVRPLDPTGIGILVAVPPLTGKALDNLSSRLRHIHDHHMATARSTVPRGSGG